MTAQFNDQFRYQEKDISISGISAGELFRPADIGLSPIPASTAAGAGILQPSLSSNHIWCSIHCP